MARKGHTEEQIIAALQQSEGEKTADICQKMGISQATFYTWKKHYAGLGIQELRELRPFRDENSRLKTPGGGYVAGRPSPVGDCRKKAVRPRARRKLAVWAREANQVSERRATRMVRLDRTTCRYRGRKDGQDTLRRRLKEIESTYVRYGYRAVDGVIAPERMESDAKGIYRLYTEEGMLVRTKQRKKLARRRRPLAPMAARRNQCWAMDFEGRPHSGEEGPRRLCPHNGPGTR